MDYACLAIHSPSAVSGGLRRIPLTAPLCDTHRSQRVTAGERDLPH